MSDPTHAKPAHADSHAAPTEVDHAGDMNLPMIATVMVVSFIVVAVAVIGTEAMFAMVENDELQTKSLAQPNQALIDLKSKQIKNIDSYRWVDAKAKTVAIPIDRAMELVLAERATAAAKAEAHADAVAATQASPE
ncbi:MAG: hypothetical protein NTW19_06945 [Planctomycetota bacterium]|nr:hypothetical protein [Planctomycetota bacterium]